MSKPVLWGFVDPQLLERGFQQQCPGMLPITCCCLQLAITLKSLFQILNLLP